jgi:hypothetical protein
MQPVVVIATLSSAIYHVPRSRIFFKFLELYGVFTRSKFASATEFRSDRPSSRSGTRDMSSWRRKGPRQPTPCPGSMLEPKILLLRVHACFYLKISLFSVVLKLWERALLKILLVRESKHGLS